MSEERQKQREKELQEQQHEKDESERKQRSINSHGVSFGSPRQNLAGLSSFSG
jgi:hypothetical protein